MFDCPWHGTGRYCEPGAVKAAKAHIELWALRRLNQGGPTPLVWTPTTPEWGEVAWVEKEANQQPTNYELLVMTSSSSSCSSSSCSFVPQEPYLNANINRGTDGHGAGLNLIP